MASGTFNLLVGIWIALAVGSMVALWSKPAPYGRFATSRQRAMVPARWAWLAMESPAVLVFVGWWWSSDQPGAPVALAFLGLWLAHYLDRAWFYPFRLRPGARPMPLELLLCGAGFNVVNASFNGAWLFAVSADYSAAWLVDPRFLVGVVVFSTGLILNRRADAVLRRLADREGGYAIPQEGLFRWVSCPNYLGEIVLWLGWALATWSLAGLSFALWTIANLVPRALAYHRWYRQRFADYPPARRALLPGLW